MNKNLPPINCKTCGVEFKPHSKWLLNCSLSCGYKYRSKNKPKTKQEDIKWNKGSQGYIIGTIWNGVKRVSVRQHRYFMELHIGNKIPITHDVHHINGIRDDNRIENLVIIEKSEHAKLTINSREFKIWDKKTWGKRLTD